MAGRQNHGDDSSKRARSRPESKKRSLDAFAIATNENPEKTGIRQNRLGEREGGNRAAKRPRDDEVEDDGEENETTNLKKQRRSTETDRFDGSDVDGGNDSEGHEWNIGQVDSEDDSDLDSDEAFGESDEEKFDGYAFSGSSNKRVNKKPTAHSRDVNLDEEDEGEESDSELEDGDLGEDAIDLAEMLDRTEEQSELGNDAHQDREDSWSGVSEDEEESDGSEVDEESDEHSSISSADEDETSDPTKVAALQDLITSLAQADQPKRTAVKQRSDGANEYNTPSDFGVTPKNKLTLQDLGLPAVKDPHIRQSLKYLSEDADNKSKGTPKRLEVPLAKRQQDRLDRAAAYEKSKETLKRWTDTVSHNRRADHLVFPLPDQDAVAAHSNKQLQRTGQSQPFNELEATIQRIMEESGLAKVGGKDDEDRIREYEDLQANKLSIEEVKARRSTVTDGEGSTLSRGSKVKTH